MNQGKIFEGEKILIELRNQNMNQAYFHEALIQIQRQILIKIANEKPLDEDEGEYFLEDGNLLKPNISLTQNFVDNGLARSVEQKKETIENIRLARSDRKELKKNLENLNLVSDSSLNPIEAAKLELQKASAAEKKDSEAQQKKISKQRKRAKKEDDMSLISYESYERQLIQNARLATLKHERVDSSSHYLRLFTIDTVNYDTLFTEEEKEIYLDAKDYYFAKDFVPASKRFKLLSDKYEEHLPIQLYLANSYKQLGFDSLAYKQYTYVAQVFPERPEGLEGLSRYYLTRGKYREAAASIIKAITIYPEDAYFAQLDRILKRMGKVLGSQWERREVYPISTARNYEEIIAKEESPWRYYQGAKSAVYSYANPAGILRPNEITNERYIELYAWKEMLAGRENIDTTFSDPKEQAAYLKKRNANKKKNIDKDKNSFPFARAMQKMGYLDCYVFISLFHNDLHASFKDFVLLHPDKIEKYFYILLNWESEKFDEFRNQNKKKATSKKKKK